MCVRVCACVRVRVCALEECLTQMSMEMVEKLQLKICLKYKYIKKI